MGGHFDGRQRVTGGSSGIGRQLQEQLNRALFFVTLALGATRHILSHAQIPVLFAR